MSIGIMYKHTTTTWEFANVLDWEECDVSLRPSRLTSTKDVTSSAAYWDICSYGYRQSKKQAAMQYPTRQRYASPIGLTTETRVLIQV